MNAKTIELLGKLSQCSYSWSIYRNADTFISLDDTHRVLANEHYTVNVDVDEDNSIDVTMKTLELALESAINWLERLQADGKASR